MLQVTHAHRSLLATIVAVAGFLVTVEGRAYCRGTTCDPRDEQCPIDPATQCFAVGVPFSWNQCPTNHKVSCVAAAEYLAWPTSCVSFDLHELGTPQVPFADVQSAVAGAFATWDAVTCGGGLPLAMATRDFGPVVCGKKGFNQDPKVANANIVTFVRPWTGERSALALTTLTYSTRTGAIYDADIEVNDEERLSAAATVTNQAGDVQAIVTHEVGHFLGLSHTQSTQHADAVMYEFYESGTDRIRVLTSDDIAGICAVYPPNRPAASSDCEPVNGWGSECAADVGKGCCAISPGRAQPGGWGALMTLVVAAASLGLRRLHRVRRKSATRWRRQLGRARVSSGSAHRC